MPGLTTHTYITYKALKMFQPKSAVLKEILASNAKARGLAQRNEYQKYTTDTCQISGCNLGAPGSHINCCILAGATYIGSCGPDLFYLEILPETVYVADLLHYNKSGPYMIWCLREAKNTLPTQQECGALSHKFRLAYCLGHISHIAADIMLHPYINSVVKSYPDNLKGTEFFDSRHPLDLNFASVGDPHYPLPPSPRPVVPFPYAPLSFYPHWYFHNKLEQYQDAHILRHKFVDAENFGDGIQSSDAWKNINIASAGAYYMLQPHNRKSWFLADYATKFYQLEYPLAAKFEQVRYEFFMGKRWFVSVFRPTDLLTVDKYYNFTIPGEDRLNERENLVQGGDNKLLDMYIDAAATKAVELWNEVDNYLEATDTYGTKDYDHPHRLKAIDKKYFPQLSKHWNLDTGLAPSVDTTGDWFRMPSPKQPLVNVVGSLEFESAHAKEMGDLE